MVGEVLEELGVPYEIKLYKRDPKTMRAPADLRAAPPEYLAVGQQVVDLAAVSLQHPPA